MDDKKLEKKFTTLKSACFRDLENLGVLISEIEQDFADSKIPHGNLSALQDFIWYQYNKNISRYSHDFDKQVMTYNSMAHFRYKYEGGKGVHELKKLAVEAKKQSYIPISLDNQITMEAVIITAKDCCDACKQDEGRSMDLQEFLNNNILPHEECTCKGFGCTCWFGVRGKRDSEGNLIWNEAVTSHSTKIANKSLKNKPTNAHLKKEGARTILGLLNFFKGRKN